MGLSFDYSYTDPPVISDTQLQLYLNGTFYNNKIGEHCPNEGFATMDIDSSTRGQVQVDFSRYTIESFLLTLFESDKLSILLTEENLPATTSFALTTSSLEDFLPGLVAAYGEDAPMELYIYATEAPTAVFTPDEMKGYVTFGIDFRIKDLESAALLIFKDGAATYSLKLEDFLLYLHFDELKIGDVYTEFSNIGTIDTNSIYKHFNLYLKAAVPVINNLLASGIEVPQQYFTRSVVADASFTSYQNYVKIQWEPYVDYT